MKGIIQDISEITDSRELLERKPLPFIQRFIYLLLAIILISLTWCYIGEIDIVVKANGIVRPNNHINTITSEVSGKIDKINLENGKKVSKGTLLLSVDSKELNLDLKNTIEELHKKEKELKNLITLRKSILEEKNFFDKNDPSETNYYYKYLKFVSDLESTRKKIESLNSNIINTKNEIEGTKGFLKSMDENKNLINDANSTYSLKFDNYLNKYNEYINKIDFSEKNYNNSKLLLESGALSENEFKKIKNEHESLVIQWESFVTTAKLDMKSSLETNIDLLKDYELQLKEMSPEASSLDDISEIIESTKTDYLINTNNEIENVQTEVSNLENSIDSLKLKLGNCNIYSPIDGHVNLIEKLSHGDIIMSGQELATIVPVDDSGYTIELYVPNKDISNINVGDSIKYHFLALPHREYGELQGKITSISIDSTVTEGKSNAYYLVESSVTNRPLYSYKGDKSQIKVGMLCEAHIITRRKRILFYLLEKIDLWD